MALSECCGCRAIENTDICSNPDCLDHAVFVEEETASDRLVKAGYDPSGMTGRERLFALKCLSSEEDHE